MLGDVKNLLFAFTPQANFPSRNLNSVNVMGSNPDYLLIYFLLHVVVTKSKEIEVKPLDSSSHL